VFSDNFHVGLMP